MKSYQKFELILVDPKEELCEAWKAAFNDHKRIEIVHGYFENVSEYDCIVSPANSFGVMDGGLDLAIIRYFGRRLQASVQDVIKSEYYGEQPVGTSFIVETGHAKHRFLAHTPTMRVPMNITQTDNVYNAMFAMLRAVANHNKQATEEQQIKKVLCAGLGTATGQVPAREAARQMELAYKYFKMPSFPVWQYLFERQRAIGYGGKLHLP